MSIIKNPLLSLGARNTISKAVTFVRRRGQDVAEKKPEIIDAKSSAQLSWRHMYQKCAVLWNALSATEKQEWESLARSRHMTGFAWFQSQCLRPNPGIYLPLQGGTMQGDIDMAKYKLLKLPLPTDDQEPITLAYTKAYIFPYLYYEGARVYHNIDFSVATATSVAIPFNSERYDTDTIHDTIVNNSRLTCKTPGKYVIAFNGYFVPNAVGYRRFWIRHNDTTNIAFARAGLCSVNTFECVLATIYDLALNDFVEVYCRQTSGGNLVITSSGNNSPEFSMQRIAP